MTRAIERNGIYYCQCGRPIQGMYYRYKCGRSWLWKHRSQKYVFAGWWDERKKPCGCS